MKNRRSTDRRGSQLWRDLGNNLKLFALFVVILATYIAYWAVR